MKFDVSKIQGNADLLAYMTHDGIVGHLHVLLAGGIPYQKIMPELQTKDYEYPAVAIALKDAGADPEDILDRIGLSFVSSNWKMTQIARFYDERLSQETTAKLLNFFGSIDSFGSFADSLHELGKKIPSDLIEAHIKDILGITEGQGSKESNKSYQYVRRVISFVDIGLDPEKALSISTGWYACKPGIYEALIERGVAPTKIWQRVSEPFSRLVLYPIWQKSGLKVDYKQLVVEVGDDFVSCIDTLLQAGADAEWLACRTRYLYTGEEKIVESLISYGASFESLKDRMAPQLIVNEYKFLKNHGISPDLKTHFTELIKKSSEDIDGSRLQGFLDDNATWLVRHGAVDSGLLASSLSGYGIKKHIESLIKFFKYQPSIMQTLITNILVKCNREEIHHIVPYILTNERYKALLKNGGLNNPQLKELLYRYLVRPDRNPDALKCNLVLENLDLVEELCPDFDIQAFLDRCPINLTSTLAYNLEKILDHNFKINFEQALFNSFTGDDFDIKCLEILGKKGYDVNWCLKGVHAASCNISKENVKSLIRIGADRDLLAFIFLENNPSILNEDLDDLFDGPTIWSSLRIDHSF